MMMHNSIDAWYMLGKRYMIGGKNACPWVILHERCNLHNAVNRTRNRSQQAWRIEKAVPSFYVNANATTLGFSRLWQ